MKKNWKKSDEMRNNLEKTYKIKIKDSINNTTTWS
jgi:cysteinyl-tRNA synthetase